MHDRTYRFIIPPILLLFYVAVAFASTFEPAKVLGEVRKLIDFEAGNQQQGFTNCNAGSTNSSVISSFVGAIFSSGVLLLTSGILIGTVTTLFFHLVDFLLWVIWHVVLLKKTEPSVYHALLFKEENESNERRADELLRKLGHPLLEQRPMPTRPYIFVVSNLVPHGVLNEGLETFLDRRWNTFCVSLNCFMAGVFAIIYVVFFSGRCPSSSWLLWWLALVLLLTIGFGYLGWNARLDIVRTAQIAINSPKLWRINPLKVDNS